MMKILLHFFVANLHLMTTQLRHCLSQLQNVFLIIMCLIIGLPAESLATCYTVYDKSDRAIYKSFEPPFDLSGSISDGIKSKFPGGYLLTDNNASCSLPKADDVSQESISAGIKKRSSDPRSRQISEVRTYKQTDDQIANGERIRGETAQPIATNPKCEELLSELENNRLGDIGSLTRVELASKKAKRNQITQEYELRCLSSGDRQANQERRSATQTQAQLRAIQDTQREIQRTQEQTRRTQEETQRTTDEIQRKQRYGY